MLDARRRRLATASRTLAQERKRLQSDQVSIEEKQSKLHITRVDAACARSEKLGTLDFIFKIEPTKTPLVFSLLGLVLPNSEGLTEEHSAVLGIAALLVNILGAYLGVGLHYPLLFAGSRSLAVDEISLIKGPRTFVILHLCPLYRLMILNRFPLYAQGVEDYRFHYAVFLLNKDIEQLCMSQRVLCTDLRQTLPNLANLLLTVTARSRPLPTSSSSTFSERHAERTKSVTFQEPLQESINSPSSPQSMDLADSSSPAATVKPRKRAKSPTPSEKIKLVTTPSANQLDEQVASDKPPTGNKSKSSLAHGSIPEQTAI